MLPVYEAVKGVPIIGLLHALALTADDVYPTQGEQADRPARGANVPATHERQAALDITPVALEYLPAEHNTHDALDVLKYEPAAQGANAVITTSPLPPFPALDDLPGNPPTPTPEM